MGRTARRLLEAVSGARRQGEAAADDDAAQRGRSQAVRGNQAPGGKHGRVVWLFTEKSPFSS